MFLSFSWHLFALAPVPCPPHSKQQWDHRGDCVLNVSRISWPRHAVEKGWTEDGEVPLQGKQTNKISHQESWLFPGHFPTGNRTSLGSQGNCLCSHTHPCPAAARTSVSWCLLNIEDMEVKTGTLSLFTSRTVVTCNNQKIDSYTQSNLSNNSQGSVKLGWPYTGRGTAYNTQAGKCSYLPHFQIIKPQHKGLTPQGDQCDFLHPHKAQRVFWSGCF